MYKKLAEFVGDCSEIIKFGKNGVKPQHIYCWLPKMERLSSISNKEISDDKASYKIIIKKYRLSPCIVRQESIVAQKQSNFNFKPVKKCDPRPQNISIQVKENKPLKFSFKPIRKVETVYSRVRNIIKEIKMSSCPYPSMKNSSDMVSTHELAIKLKIQLENKFKDQCGISMIHLAVNEFIDSNKDMKVGSARDRDNFGKLFNPKLLRPIEGRAFAQLWNDVS
jgi:hypothetical protein